MSVGTISGSRVDRMRLPTNVAKSPTRMSLPLPPARQSHCQLGIKHVPGFPTCYSDSQSSSHILGNPIPYDNRVCKVWGREHALSCASPTLLFNNVPVIVSFSTSWVGLGMVWPWSSRIVSMSIDTCQARSMADESCANIIDVQNNK